VESRLVPAKRRNPKKDMTGTGSRSRGVGADATTRTKRIRKTATATVTGVGGTEAIGLPIESITLSGKSPFLHLSNSQTTLIAKPSVFTLFVVATVAGLVAVSTTKNETRIGSAQTGTPPGTEIVSGTGTVKGTTTVLTVITDTTMIAIPTEKGMPKLLVCTLAINYLLTLFVYETSVNKWQVTFVVGSCSDEYFLLICRSRPSSRAGSEARRNDYESDQHDRTRTRSSRDKAYYDYRDRYRRDHRDPYSRGDYLLFRTCVMLGMHDLQLLASLH
jgi:hypothetical protein